MSDTTEGKFEMQRADALNRQRRVILNNDGCDVLYFPSKETITAENLLALRTTPLAGTHVDTLFYCTISSGFGCFTHDTKVGSVLDWDVGGPLGVKGVVNATRPLIEQGRDCLQIMVDFCHSNGMEIFWSIRMNDTHDGAERANKPYPLYSPIKRQCPEYLIGSYGKPVKHGQWSAVDYGRAEVRDLAYRYIEEVCRNYDVDGIEMDFFRHLNYFKSVANGGWATRDELAAMTDLVRRVREMTEREGLRRGRPILVAIRVPDSVPYSKAMGLDIERWLSEGLVDILIGTCYFQLNPWEDLVKLGHRYGAKVYPSLSEARVTGEVGPYRRASRESYRARASRVWQSGADGVYLFNFFNPNDPMLSELGDPAKLARLDKTYFAAVRSGPPAAWLSEGQKYIRIPVLNPHIPLTINKGCSRELDFPVGDDLSSLGKGVAAEAACHVLTSQPDALTVALNGTELSQRHYDGTWLDLPVPAELLRRGGNRFEFTCRPGSIAEDLDGAVVKDLALTVRFRQPS